MAQNPFHQTLDWTVQGKYARVTDDDGRVFEGGRTDPPRSGERRHARRDDRLRLYVDIETDDDRVDDALDELDSDPVDLPDGFEERIRSLVREEVEHHD